jgi:REP element-mobilizing transposase RayT
MPGAAFHVTARTQGGQPWFDDSTRDFIVEALALVQRRLDARLFAFVIMPNHIHLVLQQGDHPLGRFMHPLLTRIAMSVKRKYDFAGHVFGRRYWAHPCMSTEYLQTCVAYIHHNPVKAGLCDNAADYRWSSAPRRRNTANAVIIDPLPIGLATPLADSLLRSNADVAARPLKTMEHIVEQVLRDYRVDIDVDTLRWLRGRRPALIRRACIRRAVEAGYRNCQIARYLCVSDSVVSEVAVRVRGNGLLRPECEDGSKPEGRKRTPKK